MTRDRKTPTSTPETLFPLERFALAATQRIGSTSSLVVHSFFFIGIFALQFLDVSFNQIMLILTTVVSLEAIYLSIFIQMTVNRQGHQIEEVSEDVEEIQENVDEIQEDVGEIQEDVEDLSEEFEKDVAPEYHAFEDVSASARTQKIEEMLEIMLREIRQLKQND